MNNEEFWQLCYVIALYNGEGKAFAENQADLAAKIADLSADKLMERLNNIEEPS
jgi:hypothetical protein